MSSRFEENIIKVGDIVYREKFFPISLGRVVEKRGTQISYQNIVDSKHPIWSCDAALLKKLPDDHPAHGYPAEWIIELIKGQENISLENFNVLFNGGTE